MSKVQRAWGTYEVLLDTKGLKVKRIIVAPGGVLSLQKHAFRNEVWLFGKDSLYVEQIDPEDFTPLKADLTEEDEVIQIPAGQYHRFTNPFSKPVTFIEVQTGDKLSEDDITRLSLSTGGIE